MAGFTPIWRSGWQGLSRNGEIAPGHARRGGRPSAPPAQLYRERFGEHIPLIRRQDVKGFITRKPIWLNAILTVPMIRREVESMEQEARNFYQAAIAQTSDAAVRQLLGDLAAEESKHYELAEEMDEKQKASGAREGRRLRAPPVRAANRAAGAGRADGRLGLDPRAGLCGGLRHAPIAGTPFWSAWRPPRGGHQHGFRRGDVGRRRPERARTSLVARDGLRPDDDGRRHRPHAAVPDFQIFISPCTSRWRLSRWNSG
jgi:hypothetical protein